MITKEGEKTSVGHGWVVGEQFDTVRERTWLGWEGGWTKRKKEKEKKDPLKVIYHENLCDKPVLGVISIMLSTPIFLPLRKTNPCNECVSKLIKEKLSSQQSEHCGDQAHF